MTSLITVNSDECLVGVVGDNTIDRYRGVTGTTELIGGNALNVAMQLAMAGVRASYLGAVGRDRAGMRIADALERGRVDTSRLVIADGDTAWTDVQIRDDGDRSFAEEHYGLSGTYYPPLNDVTWLAGLAWVHIGMLPEATRLRRELREINAGAVISQDCSVASGLSDLDVAFVSASTCTDSAQFVSDASAAGVKLAVVTRGADGADAVAGTERWHQEALPTQVVDTVGAGDSFMAGVISVLVLGGSIAEALKRGARRAAATCRHPGGWPQEESGAGLTPGEAPRPRSPGRGPAAATPPPGGGVPPG
ncbi:MAG TPA: PfkB family carbohydrate kinase [Streptosporangiaceae bacterium]